MQAEGAMKRASIAEVQPIRCKDTTKSWKSVIIEIKSPGMTKRLCRNGFAHILPNEIKDGVSKVEFILGAIKKLISQPLMELMNKYTEHQQ